MVRTTFIGETLADVNAQILEAAELLTTALTAKEAVNPKPVAQMTPQKIETSAPTAAPSIPSAPKETTTQAPLPLPAAVGGERDSSGLPWDGRIHAKSKEKNADGTWRRRRNIEDEEFYKVTAELRAIVGSLPQGQSVDGPRAGVAPAGIAPMPGLNQITPPAAPTAAVLPFTMPGMPAQTPVIPAVGGMPQATPPPAKPAYKASKPLIPGQIPAFGYLEFRRDFIELLAFLIKEGKIDQAYVEACKNYFKVKEFHDVCDDDDKCEEVFKTWAEAGFITKVG
jgi:hypothetical protein